MLLRLHIDDTGVVCVTGHMTRVLCVCIVQDGANANGRIEQGQDVGVQADQGGPNGDMGITI